MKCVEGEGIRTNTRTASYYERLNGLVKNRPVFFTIETSFESFRVAGRGWAWDWA